MSSPAGSSELSEPPSPAEFTDVDDSASTPGPSSRPSVDFGHDHDLPPIKKRKIGGPSLLAFERGQPYDDDDVSLSEDGYSSGPGSPSHGEYAMRDDAQTQCLWKSCDFGEAYHNDDLVKHVQSTHCATGPKKTKYVCEWGECQRKTSNHPSAYALKAHMRSHTKEKPYYCALPECDKAFTRSDALAKHMRTVHEPEPVKNAIPTIPLDATPSTLTKGKSKAKSSTNGAPNGRSVETTAPPSLQYDENGNEIDPSPAKDNITYVPAHHPVTGQPGFMIHYPPDIVFSSYESAIHADALMSLLRRQVHWATKEGDALKSEITALEQIHKEEWEKKEVLLEGLMEAELATVTSEDLLLDVGPKAYAAIERDARRDLPRNKRFHWGGGPLDIQPRSRRRRPRPAAALAEPDENDSEADEPQDATMIDVDSGEDNGRSPSPGNDERVDGFDGDADPYDNYLAGRLAAFEESQRLRSMQSTPLKADSAEQQAADEADAVGALLGMSGGKDS